MTIALFTRIARFWSYINGDLVRISIRPGETLNWFSWERTEEGWASRGLSWTYDARSGTIFQTSQVGGRDCDGITRETLESACPLHLLALGQENCEFVEDQNNEIIRFPEWEPTKSPVRYDEYAERAGY